VEVKDNVEDTRFTIDSITFNRVNGNWVINGQEYRQFMDNRYVSEPKAEEEDNLGIPPVNITRFT